MKTSQEQLCKKDCEALGEPSHYATLIPVWQALHNKTRENIVIEDSDPLEERERVLYDDLTELIGKYIIKKMNKLK